LLAFTAKQPPMSSTDHGGGEAATVHRRIAPRRVSASFV